MFELAEIHPALELKRSKKARRVALRLDPDRHVVRLVVPERLGTRKALAFARDHQHWIEEKLASLPKPVHLKHGVTIPVLGIDRLIRVTANPAVKKTTIMLTNTELIVSSSRADVSLRIPRFLKRIAKEKLEVLAEEKAAQIGKRISSLQVRDTKSRWGSCGVGGRLSFSWRLVFAPPAAMDYLVAHEVAHMKHMNHGAKFWTLCEALAIDYTAGKAWIRNNGSELLRYKVNPVVSDGLSA